MSGSRTTEPGAARDGGYGQGHGYGYGSGRRIAAAPARRHEGAPCLSAQAGSLLLPAAMALLAGAVLLGSAHLAYAFYMKRELQNAADFAALAGVRALAGQPEAAACAAGLAAALASAGQNLRAHGEPAARGVDAACGRWDPVALQASPRHWAADESAPNSIRVVIVRRLAPIAPFMPAGDVRAEAVAAAGEPQAAFWVGSRLLRVASDGLLGRVLAGVGADPAVLDVLSHSGLANVSLQPSGLLQELGIPLSAVVDAGTGQALADVTGVELGRLVQASAAVLERAGAAEAALDALDQLMAQLRVAPPSGQPLSALQVSLLGEGGILATADLADGARALGADINALDLVAASLGVATGSRLVDVPGLSVAGLVQGALRIVEPPQIAVGPVGTRAHSAQLRVYLRAGTAAVPGLAAWLGTEVDLPLILEVGESTGELTGMCRAPLARDEADIEVASSLVKLCMGEFPALDGGVPDTFFSDANSCPSMGEDPHTIVKLLGRDVIRARLPADSLDDGLALLLPSGPTLVDPPLRVGEQRTVPGDGLSAGTLSQLGSLLADDVVSQLLDDLFATAKLSNSEAPFDLVGPSVNERVEVLLGASGAGRSLTEISAQMRYSAEALESRARQLASGDLLMGLLGVVGDLLQTVVAAPVSDAACVVAGLVGGPGAVRECKRPFVEGLVKDRNWAAALLGVVVQMLDPLLAPLGNALQALVTDTLGLHLGQTDVGLISVDCGQPRLVY